jgi:hypothetical protein
VEFQKGFEDLALGAGADELARGERRIDRGGYGRERNSEASAKNCADNRTELPASRRYRPQSRNDTAQQEGVSIRAAGRPSSSTGLVSFIDRP